MWTIVGLAIGWLTKHFTFEVAKFVAMRAMLIAVILGLGPIVIFKGLSLMIEFVTSYANSYVSGQEVQPVMVQMAGIAGYLADILKIPEGISIYLSFLGISFALRLIRVK